MKVWRLITHHEASKENDVLRYYVKNKTIAIGWGKVGDLKDQKPESASAISSSIKLTYPNLRNATSGGPSLWFFYREMQIGDIVVLQGSNLRMAVKILGDYFYEETGFILDDEYRHQRSAELIQLAPDEIKLITASGNANGTSPRWPLFYYEKPVLPRRLETTR